MNTELVDKIVRNLNRYSNEEIIIVQETIAKRINPLLLEQRILHYFGTELFDLHLSSTSGDQIMSLSSVLASLEKLEIEELAQIDCVIMFINNRRDLSSTVKDILLKYQYTTSSKEGVGFFTQTPVFGLKRR